MGRGHRPGAGPRHGERRFGLERDLRPEAKRVLTGSEDGTARLWDAATGQELVPAMKSGGAVSSATFSPDGTRVLTGSEDGTARLWDAATGQELVPAMKSDGRGLGAAFSPGRRSAS